MTLTHAESDGNLSNGFGDTPLDRRRRQRREQVLLVSVNGRLSRHAPTWAIFLPNGGLGEGDGIEVENCVSHHPSFAGNRLGYLLLRDGHAVPLRGISPEEIKAGAKHRVPNPDVEPLRHRQCLNAIVDRLGFSGDFGTFQNEGWPDFQKFLNRNGCTRRVGVFPVDHGGSIDLHFGPYGGPQPRQLADRIFEAQNARPKRVFLGYGVDWAAWDGGNGNTVPFAAVASTPADGETARRRAADLFSRRHDLLGQFGFIDDKLVNGSPRIVVDKTYWTLGSDSYKRERSLEKITAAVSAFRAVFDGKVEGWVDVLPYRDRLVVLRAHDGGWDLLWRDYREKEPPNPMLVGNALQLSVEDLPSHLMNESDRRRALHFRKNVWEEMEAHEAEQAFYDRGGSIAQRQTTSDADVLLAWIREKGLLSTPDRVKWEGPLPHGFRIVRIGERRVALSDMIIVDSYRRMLVETGYGDRRSMSDERWELANGDTSIKAPVGASWTDAQAYCSWKERKIGVALRLPTREELRAIRPAFSSHYGRLAGRDFPWEDFPPRPIAADNASDIACEVPSALVWSEPRFLEPHADLPRYPADSGYYKKSRKRRIADFPPRACWKSPLPIAAYDGLDFIDAWDAYEWCQEKGWISGRFWEGQIAANCWGAYKNVKVTFRLVIDLAE